MRGIRIEKGATFIETDGVTVRISRDGRCELSPVLFSSLEWELRTEPPESWSYITAGDIDAQTHAEIRELVDYVNKITEKEP